MNWKKPICMSLLLTLMLLHLTGCNGNQAEVTETVTASDPMASSSTAALTQLPVQSSTPVQSASEPSAEVQPESVMESSQRAVQQSSSIAQSAPSEAFSVSSEPPASTSSLEERNMNHITIAVGGKSFSATLADNEAARTFAAYLPLTVQMSDLNGQEKFYDLPKDLPSDSAERPSTIHGGDIMCWSGNTLVLFYQTFSNSYGGYVRLATVDDPSGLADALGSGKIEVTWSLTE